VATNVELTCHAYEAVNRRDLDGLLALMDPEVVAIPRILAVEGGTLEGHGGIREWWEGIFRAFPDFQTDVVGVRGIDDATIAHVRAHGAGAAFEDDIWVTTRFQDGKVVWWQTCESESDALAALGLFDGSR
jgi:ketosteroid isomerase-like protein